MDQIKVHVMFEHGPDERPFGCSYIRLLCPLSHPKLSESIELSFSTEYTKSDLVVLERLWRPDISLEFAEILLGRIRENESKIIYSLDDNLLDIPHLDLNTKMVCRLFCREADVVLVTTDQLRSRIEPLAQDVFIIGNALDEGLFHDCKRGAVNSRRDDKLIIGYMGTYTHDRDLMMVLQALRSVLDMYKDRVEFHLVGGIENRVLPQLFNGLPFRQISVPMEQAEYPEFVHWMIDNLHWDFGIAPLTRSKLNMSKSDLKFLDYSALGIPGIYSDILPYSATIEHGRTGLLVGDDVDSWVSALQNYIDDESFRTSIAREAHEKVWHSRMLKHNTDLWFELIHNIG